MPTRSMREWDVRPDSCTTELGPITVLQRPRISASKVPSSKTDMHEVVAPGHLSRQYLMQACMKLPEAHLLCEGEGQAPRR